MRAPPAEDRGLGTAYERLALYRLLERWLSGLPVETACEGPLDGVAGIPGLHLVGCARRGARVTVLHHDPGALERVRRVYRLLGAEPRLETAACRPESLPDRRRFDLVLCFNALPLIDDWPGYLERLAAMASRYLVVCMINPSSWGPTLRRALRRAGARRAPELFDHPAARPAHLERRLARLGTIARRAWFDCPWWPDLFPTGERLLEGTLRRVPLVGGRLAIAAARRGRPAFVHGPGRFPFFADQPGHAELLREIARHPAFDDGPPALTRIFGHHRAWLVERPA